MSAPPDRIPRLDDGELVEALGSSRRLGMLGSAPIADVIEHSSAFLPPLADVSGTVVDLGSGGGVPGLVIAWMRPELHVLLVDRRATRTDHLQRLVHRLGLADRVRVLTTEASALPHLLDGPVDAVVVRGFGSPQSVLETALPILVRFGLIIVSAPPTDVHLKWPAPLLESYSVTMRQPSSRVAVISMVDDSR